MSTVTATAPLTELLEAFVHADREAKAAADRAAELKDKLKLAMIESGQAADASDPLTHLELQHGQLRATLKYTETWRVDTTRLKAEQPVTYAAFAKRSSSLTLRVGVN